MSDNSSKESLIERWLARAVGCFFCAMAIYFGVYFSVALADGRVWQWMVNTLGPKYAAQK